MPGLWMPGAKVIPASLDGGTFPQDHSYGQNAYGTIHTFEGNPHQLSASSGATFLNNEHYSVHFVLNPITGEVVQTIPANRAGRGLKESGNPRTNKAGKVHFQVEVIAFAATPFTSYWTPQGRDAFHAMLAFWESWGVPMVFPNGTLAASAGAANAPGHRIAPGPSGLYGHSDWLDNDHWDPGALDIRALLPSGSAPTAATQAPTTRTALWQELVATSADGEWGDGTDSVSQLMVKVASAKNVTGLSAGDIKVVQAIVGTPQTGTWSTGDLVALAGWVKAAQRWLGVADDGDWGPNTSRAYAQARTQYHHGAGTTPPQSVTLNPYPLASTDWFGQDDGTPNSHSGLQPLDTTYVSRIQQQVGVSADGKFGPDTASAVKTKQKALGVDADGKVGRITWTKLFGG